MADETDVDDIYSRSQSDIDPVKDGGYDKIVKWLTGEGEQKATSGKKELAKSIWDKYVLDDIKTVDITKVDISKQYANTHSSLRSEIKQKAVDKTIDETDKYFDKGDLSGLKKLSFQDSELQQIRDNQLYNLTGTLTREARDKGDIGRLEQIRNDIKGTSAESEWTSDIDRYIEKLRRK
jgi:hypothetical protein